MAKITIVTLVHNPGVYIYTCVNSVLKQTFQDFEYVIVDNASSDGTKEILEAYQKKDSRIRLYRNEENNVGSLKAIETYVSTEYYMVLDHDDYLELNALECLYSVAEKEDLDIVFGCSEIVDAKGLPLGKAGLQMDLPCFEGKDIWQYFNSLYWQMRTQWGKLIRTSLTQYIDMDTMKKRQASKYAGDTVMILSMAFSARRLGTVSNVLHHYRVLDKSESQSYCRHRFLADWVLFDMARELLLKCDGLTEGNHFFLILVYFNAICDTLRVLMNSDVSDDEKMEVINEIVMKEHTFEMMDALSQLDVNERIIFTKNFGESIVTLYVRNATKPECHNLVQNWLSLLYGQNSISEQECLSLFERYKEILVLLCLDQKEQAYRDMEKNECSLQCPRLYLSLALSIEKNIKRMAQILLQAGRINPDLFQIAGEALQILSKQNELLCWMEKPVLEENPFVIAAVCAGEYELAINYCLDLLKTKKWQRSGGILELAITLAAVLGDAEVFVFLKKVNCDYLIQEKNIEGAKAVLVDLQEMCPEDEDVKALQIALSC